MLPCVMSTPRILVGTASWQEPEFIRDWYPPGLSKTKLLPWYAGHFSFVEVNGTFYGIPKASVVEQWCRQTPDDFVFDVKLHKLLSRHATPAKFLPADLRPKVEVAKGNVVLTPSIEKAVAKRFLEGIQPLIDSRKLGALLLQLSPSFRPKTAQLDDLENIFELFREHALAVELRNRDWMEGEQKDETLAFFRKSRVTLVTVDAPESEHFTVMPFSDAVTNRKLAYMRLHGRDEAAFVRGKTVAERFNYLYGEDELREIAEVAVRLGLEAGEVHVVFNNNHSNYAPKSAEELQRLLEIYHRIKSTRAKAKQGELAV
jgi:uncharacterized protein YecE (DUF72 family)